MGGPSGLCGGTLGPPFVSPLGRLDYEKRVLLGTIYCAESHDDKRRLARTQGDLIADLPVRYGAPERRRVGGCPVRVLQLKVNAIGPFLSRLGPDGSSTVQQSGRVAAGPNASSEHRQSGRGNPTRQAYPECSGSLRLLNQRQTPRRIRAWGASNYSCQDVRRGRPRRPLPGPPPGRLARRGSVD
jgi:hypothetical protein